MSIPMKINITNCIPHEDVFLKTGVVYKLPKGTKIKYNKYTYKVGNVIVLWTYDMITTSEIRDSGNSRNFTLKLTTNDYDEQNFCALQAAASCYLV